jgi:hypothetical protein
MQDLNIDPAQKRDELIADTKEAEKQAKQEQAAILEAVKNDEELTHDSTEWVAIGDAEFKVKTTLAGDVVDILQAFDSDDMPPMNKIVDAAITQTESIRTDATVITDTDTIAAFWRGYYDKHGTAAIDAIANRIMNPALEQAQEGVPQSFQGHGSR